MYFTLEKNAMSVTRTLRLALLAVLFFLPAQADAHFLWLVTSEDGGKLHLYFSEGAEPGEPELLRNARGATVHLLTAGGVPQKVDMDVGDDSLVAPLKSGEARNALFVLRHDYGVISRGESTFLLRYYAKTGPALGSPAWKIDARKHIEFDIQPEANENDIRLTVTWNGKPVAGSEVLIAGPGVDLKANSDKDGVVTFKKGKPGLYSVRARHIEEKEGEHAGKKYSSVRHYCTLAVKVPGKEDSKTTEPGDAGAKRFPDLPKGLTSFGAAIADGHLYVYGGHMGRAHSYYVEGQSDKLQRLNLKDPAGWEVVASGPPLQGLAMVSHAGKVYRVGGFTAKNKQGEPKDIWSQDDVASFDPQTKTWTALPSLPEPRSSHDAAVIGSKLYVAGGWTLQGDQQSTWLETAWVMDLAAKEPKWTALPKPPFLRRALALAAFQDKLYVIGGMQQKGGPITRVDVYDPATGKWSEGPALAGEAFEGFGCSAFAVDGRLFVSTNKGNLQELSQDGKSWKSVQKLTRARFFHRMLPLGEQSLLSVGGANMGEGKFLEVDVFDVK